MSLSLASTLAAVGLTASLAVGGAAAVVLSADDHTGPSHASPSRPVQSAAGHAGDAIQELAPGSVSAAVSAKGPRQAKVKGRVAASAEDGHVRASVAAPGSARAVVSAGGATGGVPVVPPPSRPGSGGGSPSPDLPEVDPSLPSVSQLPDSTSAEGAYTVVVPATPGTAKRLCLSGEVSRCKTITVAPTPGRTLVLRWSGNAGATRPTFSLTPCPGGLSVTVSGLATGAGVSASVDDHELSRTVSSRERSQTASLCDA